MLATLREWRTDQTEAEENQDDSVFWSIVSRLDAGEELDPETIENHISEFPDHRPVCPKHKNHSAEQFGTSKRNGVTKLRCRCNDCGEEWLQDPPDPRRDPNKWTIEELERGVELLRQRRAWSAEVEKLPALQKKRQTLRKRFDEAVEAVKAANKARDELLEEVYGVDHQIGLAKSAESQLIRTAPSKFEERQLLDRRTKLARRQREIHRELWGNGRVGEFNLPHSGTVGSDYVFHDREIARLRKKKSKKPEDQQRLANLEERKKDIKRTRVDPLEAEWNRIERELAGINARIQSMEKTKITP